MKSDTERKIYYTEGIHRRKSRLHVHLSKDLRGKLKTKKRAVLVHKSDRVKIMRGPEKGKESRVSRVDVLKRKVYLEGIIVKNARGREVLLALEPSNLLLVNLEPTEERKKIFKEEAFRKEAQKKEAPKPVGQKAPEAKPEAKTEPASKVEQKPAPAAKPAAAPAAKPAVSPAVKHENPVQANPAAVHKPVAPNQK